ncbi:WD repeat-containing protein 82 [Terramyces sp. JEL0728]|nr:WD repeat-containing protein 82 [Terramyces sp. JEL0728]
MFEQLTLELLQSMGASKVFKENTRPINAIDFDDQGGFTLTSSDDESMRIYNANSGKLQNTVYSKKYGCSLGRFTHRSNNILHCSTKNDDSIRYMSFHDNKYLSYFKAHTDKVISLEVSPQDDTFVSSSIDKTVRFWDLNTPNCAGFINTESAINPLVAFDPSAQVLALGTGNSTIRMYSMKNYGQGPFLSQLLEDTLVAVPPQWTRLQFSNDGKYILISTNSNVLYLVDAYDAVIVHRLMGHSNPLNIPLEGCFTPDAKFVMCGIL